MSDQAAADPAVDPSGASAALDTPLYNSRITSTYIKLVRTRYPHVDLDAVFRHAGMELHQINDEGHWFTQRQVNRFQEKLRELTGNPGIAREAGRFSTSPEAISGVGRYLLGLASIDQAYARADSFAVKFTRSCRMASRRLGPRSAEILVTPRPGVREEPFQCENRIGYLEAIAQIFVSRPPRIDQPECVFRGGPHCRYIVTWWPSRTILWRRARLAAILGGAGALAAAAAGMVPVAALPPLLSAAALGALACWLAEARDDNRQLRRAVGQLQTAGDELVAEIDAGADTALMLSELGQRLAAARSLRDVLDGVAGVLERRLDYDRGLILLADPPNSPLAAASFGCPPELVRALAEAGPSGHVAGAVLRRRGGARAVVLTDAGAATANAAPEVVQLARALGVRSLICCPIVNEGESLGLLAVGNVAAGRALLERDLNLVSGLTPQIALSCANLRLVEARLQQARGLNAELERRVAARTAALEGANRDLEAFSFIASHDLLAPVRDILSLAGSPELTSAAGRGKGGLELVQRVRAAGERMSLLIVDLLNFSRIGQATLRPATVDLGVLARGFLSELQQREPCRRVETRVADGLLAHADPRFVSVMMRTLVNNAWQSTAGTAGARIEVGSEDAGDTRLFFVRDNGTVFDPRQSGRVFERRHPAGEFPGTGIGLATAQRILERHGGRIRAEAAPGGGATFYFMLPARPERAGEGPAPPASQEPGEVA